MQEFLFKGNIIASQWLETGLICNYVIKKELQKHPKLKKGINIYAKLWRFKFAVN